MRLIGIVFTSPLTDDIHRLCGARPRTKGPVNNKLREEALHQWQRLRERRKAIQIKQ